MDSILKHSIFVDSNLVKATNKTEIIQKTHIQNYVWDTG